ncbi:MAG: hypothetical protein AAGG01_12935, partial [Planctomycetota bacterium]
MLRVLQHYFPVRTFLLVATELLLLGAIMAAGMTQHLWKLLADPASTHVGARSVADALARQSLMAGDGLQKCIIAALALTLVALLCLGLNRLYEFQISASRYERASRFVESAGAGVVLCLVLAGVSRLASPTGLLSFPGLTLTQTIQHLGVTVAIGFAALYVARFVFHWLVRRADLDVRVLILGSRGPAHALANQIIEHPEAGFVVVGLVPEPESTIGRRRIEPGPDLVTAQEEAASETTHRLILSQIDLLGREIENQGAAMRSDGGAQRAAQGEESLLELIEKLSVE